MFSLSSCHTVCNITTTTCVYPDIPDRSIDLFQELHIAQYAVIIGNEITEPQLPF